MARAQMEVEESSGNVFKDLGFDDDEAEELLAKADLAIQISKAIVARRLAPVEAARVLQIDRAKVSKITNGHLTDFSIGRLMSLLRRLNRDVTISVTVAARGRGRMRVLAGAKTPRKTASANQRRQPLRAPAKRDTKRATARA